MALFKKLKHPFLFILLLLSINSFTQHSIARKWNEALLNAIRIDYARPTIHARNLFHTSIALYDSWAIFDQKAKPYFLGQSTKEFVCPFNGIAIPSNTLSARQEIISYSMFRLLNHRFENSPGAVTSLAEFEHLFKKLGYDKNFISTDYSKGSYAALGNYLAQQLIAYGHQDGANEENAYINQYYTPSNPTLIPTVAGNPSITKLNRWQPLSLETFIDQSGNVSPKSTPDFLSPEWGNVLPFALPEKELTTYQRDGHDYKVYYDPKAPGFLDTPTTRSSYQWGFTLVNIWASHLDPTDGVMWDISPASIGNIQHYPTDLDGLTSFYKLLEGGDISKGHATNPFTNKPYQEQLVPRGDYTRVLAEFWADGPDSETPPGHWFTILNTINDHPQFVKKFNGKGNELDQLEWDVKAYLTLGGAVHDAAITAWGIKGWYDYLRPISAIRCMAQIGQSTDNTLSNYSPEGIPLIKDYIEVINPGDLLSGTNNENLNKIKLYTWKGHDFINDPTTDMAGVGWVLAENWWPYQRPSFVTPPFAGYVSGHSVFSRAAAEVLTLLTGSEYFPGGMGEFHVKKNEFLVFEEGPSVDFTLQWATYRDASDQTSLSRIWGGIHPPVDDIPGRLIGEKIGISAFKHATAYFDGTVTNTKNIDFNNNIRVYPNPLTKGTLLTVQFTNQLNVSSIVLFDRYGNQLNAPQTSNQSNSTFINVDDLKTGVYFLKINREETSYSKKIIIF